MYKPKRLKIVTWPDPILTKVCSVAEPVDNYVLFCEDLLHTRNNIKNAIGLAAPQVGVDLRIFVCRNKVCVNPRVLKWRGRRLPELEGCLSLPGVSGYVFRNSHIEVSYYTPEGKLIEESLKGLEARIFLHEYDHLFGILFTRRVRS